MSSAIGFPRWMPPDARETCAKIHAVAQTTADPMPEALDVLKRLATSDQMKDAWKKLENFSACNPADLVTTVFLIWLCIPLHPLRHNRSSNDDDLGRTKLAIAARAVADAASAVDPAIRAEEGITDITLTELDRAAAFFEQEAKTFHAALRIAPPPRKARAHNARQVTFVNTLCRWLWQPAGRRPYELVAILVNVAFDVKEAKQWDADRVKHCYWSRSRDR